MQRRFLDAHNPIIRGVLFVILSVATMFLFVASLFVFLSSITGENDPLGFVILFLTFISGWLLTRLDPRAPAPNTSSAPPALVASRQLPSKRRQGPSNRTMRVALRILQVIGLLMIVWGVTFFMSYGRYDAFNLVFVGVLLLWAPALQRIERSPRGALFAEIRNAFCYAAVELLFALKRLGRQSMRSSATSMRC